MKTKIALLTFIVIGLASLCFIPQQTATDRLPCVNKTFSVVVHILKDNQGQPTVSQSEIQKDITLLNKHFKPICVSFEICEFQYIERPWVQDDEPYENLGDMKVLYNVENRINLYYGLKTEILGYEVFGGIKDLATLNNGGIFYRNISTYNGTDKRILQGMGRFFGLVLTNTNPGSELVNGSNSSTAGDLITDTPADPFHYDMVDPVTYLAWAHYLDFTSSTTPPPCKFISKLKDKNGQYYDPIVGNAMSLYPCLCDEPYAFTREQYKKMANTYLANNPAGW
jgi:hypothetical protein